MVDWALNVKNPSISQMDLLKQLLKETKNNNRCC